MRPFPSLSVRPVLGLAAVLALGVVVLRPGAFGFSGTSDAYAAHLPEARTEADLGIVTFAFGDWGALTDATLREAASPWKLATAALALQATGGDPVAAAALTPAEIYRPFGLPSPETFANWPQTMAPPDIPPVLGLNRGLASNGVLPLGATIANIGCAACHASVAYDATGAPDLTTVWLGMPNGSINLEAYVTALYAAFRDQGADPDRLMAQVDRMFPDTGFAERLTLRRFVLPAILQTVAAREATTGRLLPFRASLAGATNGLDSLRNRLGMVDPDVLVTESIFNSVPDLGGRLWRTKLLNSGTYAIPGIDHTAPVSLPDIDDAHRLGLAGIIAFFTVPAMGVTPEVAQAHIPDALAITAWMQDYAAQPFPGTIDTSRLAEGQAIYARACADCHGSYDDSLTDPALLSFPNWEGDIGTDPERARLLTQDIADAVNGGLFGQYIAARTVAGYAAPPLEGIWASAPYLHNGSVPTLWHLMRPEERPVWFEVGGHRIDLMRVGIDLAPPVGYVPWSTPAEVDTTAFGLDNGGHEVGFDALTEAEKDALLEYLKLL